MFPPALTSLPHLMPSDLECAQHLRERFKALHCPEIVANWSSMPRERTEIAQQLRRDADTLREMLRETNAQLNVLAPIGRLPPEILGTVFTLVAQAEVPQHASGTAAGTLGWVRLSHICRSWRELCIGTSSLWSRAIGRLPRALHIFMERAGNYVPLDFYLSPGWDRRLHGRRYTQYIAADVIHKHSKRVERLELRNGSFSESVSIQETLATHTFGVLNYLRVESAALPAIDVIISPLRANTLRTLHFQAFFMPFVAPRLTTLSLHAINSRLDTAGLYKIIQNCPLLETIWLSNMNHLRFAELAGLPILRLPRLRRLHLDLVISGQDLNSFIRSLAIPHTTQLVIHRAKFDVLGDFLLIETIFEVTATANEEIALVFVGNTLALEAVYRTGHPRRHKAAFEFRNLTELSHTLHLLHLELEPYLKSVTHLTMRSPTSCTVGTWERIFDVLRSIETLEITTQLDSTAPTVARSFPAKTVLEAVGQCFDEYGIPLPILPLPKLANITLTVTLSQALEQASIQRDLLACLRTRSFAEAQPIQTLVLKGVKRMDPMVAKALCQLVKRVAWKSP